MTESSSLPVDYPIKASPNITFVCCVESGWLEAQTIRMVESLRRWGGQFANTPIIAVKPRLGPPISHKTRQVFDRWQVEYLPIQVKKKKRYPWFRFLNKPYALIEVEERSTSEYICWLDSDLLFLGEPDQLILKEGEDFVACASDKNIGTVGPEDAFEPYWKEICQVVGIDVKDLPWVTTQMEGKRIRLYWNSGIFVYRRKTSLAKHHLETSVQLLESRIANHNAGIYFTDQIAIGLAMVKMGLSWRALPYSHNYTMSSLIHEEWYKEQQLKEALIIHYHDAMWPHFWPEFLRCMGNTHPDVADWLNSLGPMKNEASAHWRAVSKMLNFLRAQKESAYEKLCRIV
jgi:hypothetical protein